jgi:hypothetical protein
LSNYLPVFLCGLLTLKFAGDTRREKFAGPVQANGGPRIIRC